MTHGSGSDRFIAMTVAVLIFAIVFAQIAFRLDKRGLGFKLLFVSLLATFLIGGGPLTHFVLGDLQTSSPLSTPVWGKKNAIIVLGGGTVKYQEIVLTSSFAVGRQFEGLRLYRGCKEDAARECKLVVSGGDPLKSGQSEADVMARELRSAGVANEDLLIENKSKNTYQNARFVSEMLKPLAFDQTVLVTSGLHMKRARLYFENFAVNALAAPCDRIGAIWALIPISFNFALFDLAVHEYLGILRLHAYNWLGLNS